MATQLVLVWSGITARGVYELLCRDKLLQGLALSWESRKSTKKKKLSFFPAQQLIIQTYLHPFISVYLISGDGGVVDNTRIRDHHHYQNASFLQDDLKGIKYVFLYEVYSNNS